MKSNYYLYIDSNDLNNFLVKNFIYPYDENYGLSRSLSLLLPNGIIVTNKKIKKSQVFDYCSSGFTQPVVLELALDLSKSKRILKIEDSMFLINDIISFSCVKKIYYLEERYQPMIFNDIYLFDSLVSEKNFEGEEVFEFSSISNINLENISSKVFLWDKIQAFYLARFGFLLDSSYDKKKKIVFKRNIDQDSFKYICDDQYINFINNYYNKSDIKAASSSILDESTTYLNDNFEKILINCISDENKQLFCENDEETLFYNEIYKIALFSSDYSAFKIDMINFIKKFEEINNQITFIYENIYSSLANIKKFFKENIDRKLMLTFLLLEIVDKDLDSALSYITNFTKASEFEKELLSLYGLVNGMNKINIQVKQKADTLLFAFNKTKKYFADYIDISITYTEYYNDRGYIYENIMNDGFDLKIFNQKEEETYICNYFINFLSAKFNIDKKQFNKRIFKAPNSPNELHTLFINLKKEVSKWEN